MNQSRGGAFTAQISRKRKEREDFFLPGFNGNNNKNHHYHVIKGKQVQSQPTSPKTTSSVQKPNVSVPVRSNRLLAGYMAHEFLTKGTLMGQIFDPVRDHIDPIKKTVPATPRPSPELKTKTYAEVAILLKTDGAHIPGIVNPTQLARWIQK